MSSPDFERGFRSIAARLNGLEPTADAQPFFDLLSGGIVWTDERPTFPTSAEELGAVRALWSYRTSLYMGTPREAFAGLWWLARSVAPRWPGFLPERLQPAEEIRQLVPRKA